jgi:LacI family transcriptional regulator
MKAAKTKTGNDEGNIRLVDVAKRADVSVATVSRVMNTPQVVRPDVRQRVNDVIKEMGYTRNAAARALRSQSNRLFGALVPTLNQAIYAAMIDALQRRLSEKGYLLVVGQTDFSPETELLHVNSLIEHGAEALVLVGHAHSPELYQLLERKKIPFINTYTYSPDSGHPCVGFDNALATRQMADFVMDLGHQDVAMIVGITKNNDRATERLEGVRQAIAARGMTLNPDYVFESRYTIDGGRHAMRQLLRLERPPDRRADRLRCTGFRRAGGMQGARDRGARTGVDCRFRRYGICRPSRSAFDDFAGAGGPDGAECGGLSAGLRGQRTAL